MTRQKRSKQQIYTDPDTLLSKAFEYFAWCEQNPWIKKELMRSGDKKGEFIEIPVLRPFTLAGMCVYCGISESTFVRYGKDEQMRDAASHILGIIRQNCIEGAISGEYNATFVANLLEDLY
ncbi:terminase small subunit [Dysgonomonas termitidis]|uniref:Terminase small subunit n=1 Tax=Dysgonomonas termitidis TaxID=1516126 RepID=A0ABV9KQP0_9BACT